MAEVSTCVTEALLVTDVNSEVSVVVGSPSELVGVIVEKDVKVETDGDGVKVEVVTNDVLDVVSGVDVGVDDVELSF